MNIIKKLFEVRTCTKCKRPLGETSFRGKNDELCNVCRHYQYGEEVACCEYLITLFHGDPEMCHACGRPYIMWGAKIYKGEPFTWLPEMESREICIPEVFFYKNGFEEYMERVDRISSKIENEKLAKFYREFHLSHASESKRKREVMMMKYRQINQSFFSIMFRK